MINAPGRDESMAGRFSYVEEKMNQQKHMAKVYRSAARMCARKKNPEYACDAITLALNHRGLCLPFDRTHEYVRRFQSLFQPDDFQPQQIGYWEKDYIGKKERTFALLLMADICEAGDA